MDLTMNLTESDDFFTATNETLHLVFHLNRTANYSHVFRKLPSVTAGETFIIACYSVIVLVSIFGNLLVCNILARSSSLRTSTYIFIANLALSDFIMTVLNIPFNVARILLRDWPFGSFMCSFVPLVQVTSVYVSTFTMTCIAVDRYRIISKPLEPRLRNAGTIKMLVLVVILFAICWLPLNVYNVLREFNAAHFIYKSSRHSTIFFICHWLAMSSVCYNPFIYCWLNEHFRSGAVSCLRCIKGVGIQLNHSLRSTKEFRLTSLHFDTPSLSMDSRQESNCDSFTTNAIQLVEYQPTSRSASRWIHHETRTFLPKTSLSTTDFNIATTRSASLPHSSGHCTPLEKDACLEDKCELSNGSVQKKRHRHPVRKYFSCGH